MRGLSPSIDRVNFPREVLGNRRCQGCLAMQPPFTALLRGKHGGMGRGKVVEARLVGWRDCRPCFTGGASQPLRAFCGRQGASLGSAQRDKKRLTISASISAIPERSKELNGSLFGLRNTATLRCGLIVRSRVMAPTDSK